MQQNLINLQTKEVVDQYNFRLRFPSTSFPYPLTPADLSGTGYALYEYRDRPTPEWNQKVIEAPMMLNGDGIYEQKWAVVDLEGAELAAATAIRIEVIKNEIISREQYQQDAFAKTRGYDDIKSATGYAGCGVPKFDAEGVYCKNIRAQRWAALYVIMDQVIAGVRPMPGCHSEIESELPAMVWPV